MENKEIVEDVQDTENIESIDKIETPIELKKRRIPTPAKVAIVSCAVVILLFIALGIYVSVSNAIMPNITIDGIGVSGLSRNEAFTALNVLENEERKRNAMVIIQLPDESEFVMTGEEASLRTTVRYAIDTAYTFSRGNGFIADTISFMRRSLGDVVNFETHLELDKNYVFKQTEQFIAEYNNELSALTPNVNDYYIIITLGAGHTIACVYDVSSLIFNGLFESAESGQTVVIGYVPPEFPEYRIVAELEMLWQKTRVLPESARFDRETRQIIDHVYGVSFDFAKAMNTLRTTGVGEIAVIEFDKTEPEMTTEYAERHLFVDIIGEETTFVSGTLDRLHNIRIASEAIDGYVVEPGEEFSFNRIVGPRSVATGFRVATVIVNGQFVPGIGGGICQVSSTLFSGIMDTNLQVLERRPHRLRVTYLPVGRDAAVAWGAIDFRFKNNTDWPLRIDVELVERVLTIRVVGTLPEGWEATIRGR